MVDFGRDWYKHESGEIVFLFTSFKLETITKDVFTGQIFGLNKNRDIITIRCDKIPARFLNKMATLDRLKRYSIMVVGLVKMETQTSGFITDSTNFFLLSSDLTHDVIEKTQQVSLSQLNLW